MKRFPRNNHKKGFTTMEVILVVAILTIAMAIVVPGVVTLSRNLKIAKLDDIAREIYTSAQSRSISLSISGQLPEVSNQAVILADDGTLKLSDTIKYLYKDDENINSTTETILPLGSIDEGVRQNFYIIEYNPTTAMINGVYYWENKENKFLEDIDNGYGILNPTDRNARMNYKGGMVGYYNGDDVGNRLSPNPDSTVTAELINDEELYLNIRQGRNGANALSGTITITLTDLDKNVSEVISFENNNISTIPDEYKDILKFESFRTDMAGNPITNAEWGPNFKLTLDSLKSEMRFSKLYEKWNNGTDAFHPGCNLRVTVAFQETGKQAQEQVFLTNSLFASAEDEPVVAGQPRNRTAYIACARHLENLGLLWVYQNKVSGEPGVSLEEKYIDDKLNGVVRAVQTNNIDWYESLTKIGVNLEITEPTPFKPIINGNLQEFDGAGNIISHIVISGEVDKLLNGDKERTDVGIGLFSRFEGEKIEKVNLVNCTVRELDFTEIDDSASVYVGLLAGMIDTDSAPTCEVTGCRAYATVDPTSKDVNPCSINAPAKTTSAGGLFGSIQNTKMEQCSASLTEILGDAQHVGGLVGRVDCSSDNVTITQCYADTGVWNVTQGKWEKGLSGTNVGGLLGLITGNQTFKMESSYAVGGVIKGTPCGFVGDLEGSSSGSREIKNCYAALMQDGNIVEKLAPDNVTVDSTCKKYTGNNVDFDELKSTAADTFVDGTADTTHPYGLCQTSDGVQPVYPFPRLKNMPHYGDWPDAGSGVQLAYYEVYKNGSNYSIGFYSEKEFEAFELKDEKNYEVVMDGYAVMLPVTDAGKYGDIVVSNLLEDGLQKTDSLIVNYNGEKITENNLKLRNAKEKFKDINGISVSGIGIDTNNKINLGTAETPKYYYPLFLSSKMMAEKIEKPDSTPGERKYYDKTNSYYQKLEVIIKKTADPAAPAASAETTTILNVYFNPYVAKSTIVPVTEPLAGETESYPKAPDFSIMRTSRQITAYSFEAMQTNAIGYTEDENTKKSHTLRLERDIDLTSNASKIKTDSTIASDTLQCKDLSIPKTIEGENLPYVILELNGKTLTGTEKHRAITCLGGNLEVYGKQKKELTNGTVNGTIQGGGIDMSASVSGLLKDVNIVYIKDSLDGDKGSVSVKVSDGVTLEGCTITEQ